MILLKDLQKIIPKTRSSLMQDIKRNKYRITFNLRTAIYFRKKGYKVIAWGIDYKGNKLYVFDAEPININDLPF